MRCITNFVIIEKIYRFLVKESNDLQSLAACHVVFEETSFLLQITITKSTKDEGSRMVCQGLQGEDDPILAATKKGWENDMSRSSRSVPNKLGGGGVSYQAVT